MPRPLCCHSCEIHARYEQRCRWSLISQVLDCLRAIEKARDAGLIDFHRPGTRFSVEEYVHFEQVRPHPQIAPSRAARPALPAQWPSMPSHAYMGPIAQPHAALFAPEPARDPLFLLFVSSPGP